MTDFQKPLYPNIYNAYAPYPQPFPAPTVQQTAFQSQQIAPQPMSPPMRTVDIIQVKSVDEAGNWPVNVGTTQMFQLVDDSAIITKEVYANGQYNVDVYAKQPKKAAAPPFDPSLYVTRDELDRRLAEVLTPAERRSMNGEPVSPTAANAG